VVTHPDGPLYVGDQVSFEVIAPGEADMADQRVEVEMPQAVEQETASQVFSPYGIGKRQQATFLWAWDTAGLEAGEHEVTFSVQPDGPRWTETYTLFPQDEAPPPEPEAAWSEKPNDCCLLRYITGTRAEDDLQALLAMTSAQARRASQRLGVELEKPVAVVFLPRVLGHGGFAGDEISLSYLRRNYAGGDTQTILHHEIVHILDGRLGGELRPTMLVEGLAVYLSGGHYKPEALGRRAAALLPPQPGCVEASESPGEGEAPTDQVPCGLGWYIPLDKLVEDFYTEQHEIGYLEAGALIEFMVETWGWEAYSDFYRDIHPAPEPLPEDPDLHGAQRRAMQAALRAHFGISLEQLEERFLEALRQEPLTPADVEDVRLTISFYDTVRRYQQALDPSAYFLNAWLPDGAEMRKRGIVADVLRHPNEAENLALETMLAAANARLLRGEYASTQRLLEAANAALDILEAGGEITAARQGQALAHILQAASYQSGPQE
jgi:hypothetical protein